MLGKGLRVCHCGPMPAASAPRLTLSASLPRSATAVGRGVTTEGVDQLGPDQRRAAELSGFEAGVGQVFVWTGPADEPLTVHVGLGPKEEITVDTLRRAAAAFVRSIGEHQAVACALAEDVGLDTPEAVAAIAEGLGLASYRFDDYKSDPAKRALRRISVLGKGTGVRKAFDIAVARVEAVTLARDLTNRPGGDLTPEAFAAAAKEAGAAAGLKVTVWDERRITRQRFGGLLAVNKGSTHPPRFVVAYSTSRSTTSREKSGCQ